jgi:acetoacetate decarboxylase
VRQDPANYGEMPLIKGPLFDLAKLPQIAYPDVQVLALQYLTEPGAAQALLPNCYRVAEKPLVTIVFGYNNGLAFMAGGGYRLATVQVAARFDGERDHVEGDHILVMFENRTRPILGGREHLGVPKQYADVSALKVLPDGHLRCETSLWGHLLFGIDLPPLRKQNALVRLVANRQINARPWLAYKHISSLDGPPDADYPTITQNDSRLEKLWLGKAGRVYYGDPGPEDVSHISAVVDALKTLPVRRVEQALRFRGSAVLRMDLSRRLR